jgi:hypothetical protein
MILLYCYMAYELNENIMVEWKCIAVMEDRWSKMKHNSGVRRFNYIQSFSGKIKDDYTEHSRTMLC